MKKIAINQSGFALITFLVFAIIAITVITAAALIVTTSILAGSESERGLKAYYVAESGAEDGMLRLLRNPSISTATPYTVTTDNGNAVVTIQNSVVGGTITDTILAVGTNGTTTRKIQAVTTFVSGKRNVTSWREIQ